VMEGGGAEVEGFMVSSPLTQGPEYDAFVAAYQEKFGTVPISIFHAHAYDAYMMIKAAIESVGITLDDGSLVIPRQALRDAMYSTENFDGLTGNLSCTPTGDCADPYIAVYEYHAGEYPPEVIWQP
jgi:branched-chain amino acid transport system substrate-binding protein